MITQKQLAFKKGKIGASQCAAALGVSPWQSQASLYHEILGNLTPEPLGEKGIIGNEIEPVIIKAYERATGIDVNVVPDTLIHPDHPWMICHLDGEMPAYEMILEIKNVGWTVAHHWGLDGDPSGTPMYVTAQCIHQAILADVDRVDVAAFFGGNELRVYPLTISQEAKDSVLKRLTSFWDNNVTKKVQPEVTEKDIDLLKTLYWRAANDKPMFVDSTATAIMFEDYRKLKSDIKEAEVKRDNYKAKIQNVMEECTVMMRGEDQEFTWRKTKDKQVTDYKGVVEDCRELAGRDFTTSFTQEVFFDLLEQGNTTTKIGHRVFLDKAK